jgi:hypothetical protein
LVTILDIKAIFRGRYCKGNKGNDCVAICGPFALNHKNKWKRKKPDILVFINGYYRSGNPIIGVDCYRPEYDPRQVIAWITLGSP